MFVFLLCTPCPLRILARSCIDPGRMSSLQKLCISQIELRNCQVRCFFPFLCNATPLPWSRKTYLVGMAKWNADFYTCLFLFLCNTTAVPWRKVEAIFKRNWQVRCWLLHLPLPLSLQCHTSAVTPSRKRMFSWNLPSGILTFTVASSSFTAMLHLWHDPKQKT